MYTYFTMMPARVCVCVCARAVWANNRMGSLHFVYERDRAYSDNLHRYLLFHLQAIYYHLGRDYHSRGKQNWPASERQREGLTQTGGLWSRSRSHVFSTWESLAFKKCFCCCLLACIATTDPKVTRKNPGRMNILYYIATSIYEKGTETELCWGFVFFFFPALPFYTHTPIQQFPNSRCLLYSRDWMCAHSTFTSRKYLTTSVSAYKVRNYIEMVPSKGTTLNSQKKGSSSLSISGRSHIFANTQRINEKKKKHARNRNEPPKELYRSSCLSDI